MKRNITLDKLTFVFFLLIAFSSCVSKRNLVYLSNLPDSTILNENIINAIDPEIQPGDALAIKVTTLNPESNILFNSGSVPIANNSNFNNLNSSSGLPSGVSNIATLKDGYLVDKNGNINFPILGSIKLGGLTMEEAQKKMVRMISKSDKGAIVNISIQNFKITVIGEVTKPGSFTITNDRINILEALGMAGDMTPYSVRDNVLVIREQNGKRSIERLDLNNKEVLNSPFFYLQQNDIVYVQPENKLKASQADTRYIRVVPILTAAISALAIVLSRIL